MNVPPVQVVQHFVLKVESSENKAKDLKKSHLIEGFLNIMKIEGISKNMDINSIK